MRGQQRANCPSHYTIKEKNLSKSCQSSRTPRACQPRAMLDLTGQVAVCALTRIVAVCVLTRTPCTAQCTLLQWYWLPSTRAVGTRETMAHPRVVSAFAPPPLQKSLMHWPSCGASQATSRVQICRVTGARRKLSQSAPKLFPTITTTSPWPSASPYFFRIHFSAIFPTITTSNSAHLL